MRMARVPLFLLIALLVIVATPAARPTNSVAYLSGSEELTEIGLATNDIIYDPFTQKIYASVPSSAGGIGNTITSIDPFTGTLGSSVFIGSEPGKLAISDNGQYLYVSLDGAAAVRRFDIASQTAGLQFSVGSDGPYYVEDIEVLPGNAEAVAVSRKQLGGSPRHLGVAIYDNGVQRPDTTPGHTGSNVIEFSASASTLYGCNNETTEFGFRRMSVDASGVSVVEVTGNLCSGFNVDIKFDAGLIYMTSGRVIDPDAGTIVGTYPASGLVEPDSTLGRTYFLTGSGATRTLLTFDQSTFTLLGSLDIPGVSGAASSLIRWGAEGLAFRTSSNQVFLIQTPPVLSFAIYLPLALKNYCPDFFDDFSNPASGWWVGEDSYVRAEYLSGEYRVLSKQAGYLYLFDAPTCDRENYVVELDARWRGTPGSTYGILFGITDGFSQYYLFDMNTDFRQFRLYRRDPTGFTQIVPPTYSAAINGGTASNHMKATRNGSSITLEVNGTVLGTWSDSAISGLTGVGLVSSPYSNRPVSDARFDNFRVTSLMSTGGAAQGLTQLATGTCEPRGCQTRLEPVPAQMGW